MRKVERIVSAVVMVVGVSWAVSVHAQVRTQRTAKVSGIQFFKATTTQTPGYRSVDLDGGSTLFVAPRIAFSDRAVHAATVITSRGEALQLTLTDEARAQLADADQLAIYMNKQFFASASIASLSDAGQITITGLSSRQLDRLSQLLKRKDVIMAGGTVTIVPRQTSVHPGDLLTVDMFLTGATGVRAYQVMLDTAGGDSGSISRDLMILDANRQDYIFFGTDEIIKGEDQVNGRVGAVKIYGAVNIDQSVYLGSETFLVSDDASGSFQINVRRIDTLVTDDKGNPMPYRVVNTTITVN